MTSIEASFQWLTPIDGSQGRVVITDEMLNIQWEKAVLYPAGYYARQITVQPTLRLPAGWQYGAGLDTTSFQNGVAVFAPITLAILINQIGSKAASSVRTRRTRNDLMTKPCQG